MNLKTAKCHGKKQTNFWDNPTFREHVFWIGQEIKDK